MTDTPKDTCDLNRQPAWVCHTCGSVYGTRAVWIATWHEGTCGVCHERVAVTEARDFGYLKRGWWRHGK